MVSTTLMLLWPRREVWLIRSSDSSISAQHISSELHMTVGGPGQTTGSTTSLCTCTRRTSFSRGRFTKSCRLGLWKRTSMRNSGTGNFTTQPASKGKCFPLHSSRRSTQIRCQTGHISTTRVSRLFQTLGEDLRTLFTTTRVRLSAF